jgi:hypothetical protein
MFPCMLVGVCLRMCVSVCAGWCLQVELPTVLELESRPLGAAWHRRTVMSLAPGAARRPPGGLGIGADDLPTTNWRRTQHV